ncbi:MAG: ROK family transcriptional regulator [Actinomycetota bacterium]
MRADAADGSLEALRERNRLRVVDALRRSGTATRSELAQMTGLSRTTVATLVGDLQTAGLVVGADDEQALARSGGRGRPPALLRLDPSAGVALGIDLGHSHVRVAVADLSSALLGEADAPVDVDHDADRALDTASRLVDDVLAQAGVERDRVIGAGMGLPGPYDRGLQMVNSATILPGWVGRNAAEELGARIGVQVEVDNDANLGALGELTFGAARGISNGIYMKMSTGIGAGLILGGTLHRGATGIAGELGHVQVQADGIACNCGGRGCLQTVAAVPGLLAAARGAHGPDLELAGLIELVRNGDFGTRRIVGEAGRAIGRVLADLCNHLNPEAIIVGGDLSAVGDPLLAGIREAIDRYALPGAAEAVEVRAAVLGERAEVLGALSLVIADTERLRSAGLAALQRAGWRQEVSAGST